MSLFDDLPEPTSKSKDIDSSKEDSNISKPIIDEKSKIIDSVDLFPLLLSVTGMKGERPDMQDAHMYLEDLRSCIRKSSPNDEMSRISYFAVFDGHGGNRASTFAAKRLHQHLAVRFPRGGMKEIERDIRRILYDSYKRTDEEFLREACQHRPHWRDGSTAATVLLVNNTLYIANLGDSKVVLARAVEKPVLTSVNPNPNHSHAETPDTSTTDVHLTALCLTRDHNAVDYEERQRIQATGATVQNGRVNNILEVSRSFGDYQFKKQGVICIPDIRKCQLTPNDKFLLIACDGLWKSFPPNEAVLLTNRLLMKELSAAHSQSQQFVHGESSDAISRFSQRHLDSVCSHLVTEAVLRMSGDNVTCILVVFPDAFKCDGPSRKNGSMKTDVKGEKKDSPKTLNEQDDTANEVYEPATKHIRLS